MAHGQRQFRSPAPVCLGDADAPPATKRAVFVAVLLGVLWMVPASARAQTDSVPPSPPPGRLIDVGGWRMHLYCTGSRAASRPTVILEAGAGDFSVDWSLVQPGVSSFARVCSYDRSDEGWSDWGPHPRTLHQDVYELHTLLQRGDEPPPFVLVGHSYGGWIARLYASTYRSDVVGLVLVEGGLDNPARMLGNGKIVHNADLVTGRPIPAVKASGPLRVSDIPGPALAAMKAAAVEMTPHANEPPRNKLPPDAQAMRTWATAQIKHYGISDNPVEPEEIAGLAAERVQSAQPYGPMPLVVLVRGVAEDQGPDNNAASEAERRRAFAELASLSSRGRLIVAEHSGHHVPLDQPELVIATIRDVVTAVVHQ